MKLYNSLTKKIEEFTPTSDTISIYSCGPTVYDNLHIGNLSAFIYADVMRRVLKVCYPDNTIKHVMNITDVDDKTIRDSRSADPEPMKALISHTRQYERVFMDDMALVGNDTSAIQFIRATDSIDDMLAMICELYSSKVAYIADDGVYFSIEAYKHLGKVYGQLVHIDQSSTSNSRINNDEYDKDSAHDFALWKIAKDGEPSWKFELDGQKLDGRPGWHIECSAMSRKLLGQPFDIHTGGIDLKFPHHENEIAQSTACTTDAVMARFFVHNEHVLVDGTKMSKSLGNFYTLRDVVQRGFDPLALRMLVLQGHYRNSVNFSWANLEAAQNRLSHWRNVACLRWQRPKLSGSTTHDTNHEREVVDILARDLNTPDLLSAISMRIQFIESNQEVGPSEILGYFRVIDLVLGLNIISSTPDISDSQKTTLQQRAAARENSDFTKSDALRDALLGQGVQVLDTPYGQLWHYVLSNVDTE